MAEEKKDIPVTQERPDDAKAQLAMYAQQLAVAQAVAAKERNRSEELAHLVDRMQADFDNYRKRNTEQNKKQKEDGIVAVIEKVVPVLDDMKRAIALITDEKIADGVKMIYRQLSEMLSSFGVTEIPALGEQFDPNLHNAIMQVKVKDADKINMVVEVFQKGYRMGDRIIRHSVVKVAK